MSCVYSSTQFKFKIFYLLQNAVRGCFLGSVCGLGLMFSFHMSSWQHFGWYLTCLSIFHWSEFYTTAVTNPKSLTLESYLLDHSREYKIAATASWIEFTIEWYLFPGKMENEICLRSSHVIVFFKSLNY